MHAYKVVQLDTVQPYDRNPRTHSPEQIAQLRQSIREFGFTNPLLLDERDRLIAGHGRMVAAKAEGFTELPAIVVEGLSEGQRRALVIADNQLAINASWNDELLRGELLSIQDQIIDLSLVGMNDADLSRLLRGIDEAPAPDAADEWEGMPEFVQPDKSAFRVLIVHFKDQAAVDTFSSLVDQVLTLKTKSLWYPEVPNQVTKDKRYSAEPQ